MRDYRGVALYPVKDPETRQALSTIDIFLRDLSFAMGRIQRGQVPDSSGDTIINQVVSDLYWYKPGMPAGTHIAFGETSPGGSATISSTANPDKGFIYLGEARTSAFDESNQYLGLNEPNPSARLHMVVPNVVSVSARPNNVTSSVNWAANSGTQTAALSDDSDGTWCRMDSPLTFGGGTLTATIAAQTDPGTDTGLALKLRMRSDAGTAYRIHVRFKNSTPGLDITNIVYGGAANTDFTAPAFQTNIATTLTTYTYTLSPAEAATISWGDTYEVSVVNNGVDNNDIDIADVWFSIPPAGGASTVTLQNWSTPTYTNLLEYADDGTGAGTVDMVLSGDAPFRVNSGGGTSGLRLLTSSTNGRLEVGTASQTNMNMVLSGARDATGTLLTSKFTTTELTGTLKLDGSSSGSVSQSAGTTPVAYTVTWPPAVGADNRFLKTTNGTGSTEWGTIDASDLPGTLSGFATPTVDVDVIAEDGGVLTTALRSDARLQLSQAIVPTWTGAHTWTASAATLPIQINQATSQSANLLRVSSVAAVGDSLFRVSQTGEVICGHNGGTQDDSVRKLVVRGNSTQSVDLVAIQTETTTVSAFDTIGRFKFFDSSGTNSTTWDRTAGGTNHSLLWPNAQGAADRYLRNDGVGALTWAQVSLTLGVTGTLPATNGGTGNASYAVGDILYASTTTALSRLADVAVGSYLRSGGVGVAPLWSTLVLPNAITSGAILYGSATNVAATSAALAANGVVYGGGAGVAPATTAAGTTSQVLIGGTPPSFGAVPAAALDADLQEIAAVANLRGDILITNSGPTWVRLAISTTTGTFLRSDSTDAAWSLLALPNGITSGGILYGSSLNVAASSGSLAANGVVYGGGAGVAPNTTAAGTTSQVLIGGTPPSFGNVPAAALPGTFSGFATPSANSVNVSAPTAGIAATAIRSDATLQIDQAIAPTWTALHIWNDVGIQLLGTAGGPQPITWRNAVPVTPRNTTFGVVEVHSTLTNAVVELPNIPGQVVSSGSGTAPPTASQVLGKVNLTGVGTGHATYPLGTIASTNLTSGAPAAMYLVLVELICTTAEAASATITLTLSWTDVSARSDTVTRIMTVAGVSSKLFPIYIPSGNISYAVAGYTDPGGGVTPQYTVRIRTMFAGT